MGRIGIETKRDIATTQSMVMDEVGKKLATLQATNNNVIDAVVFCDDRAIARLGDAGKVLKRFTNQIAIKHPEMSDLMQENDWGKFSRDVLQALASSDSDSPGAPLAAIRSRINNDYKSILRLLSAPKPRFLRDPLRRSDARAEKKHIKHIDLKQVYMLGENAFYGKPSSFKMFVRNKSHVNEVAKMEDQKKVFLSHNMAEVAYVVDKRINELKEMQKLSHLGFHRLKPTDAAMIAARMFDLKWHELHFITVPFRFFERRYWMDQPHEDKREDKRGLSVKKMASADNAAFSYQPRLYPLSKFPDLSNTLTKIISAVESFPDMGGYPVFDYYWVLVPSININHPYFHTKDGEWKVYVKCHTWNDLELKTFMDEYEAAFALDKQLIADGYFMPIVLGEKNGMCYFLCSWCAVE